MTLPLYSVAPDPSGADDTAAVQAAIDATPDCGCLVFPANAAYTITVPLKVYSRAGLRLISFGGLDTKPLGRRGTEFVWKGNGGVALFDCNYAHRVSLEGFALSFDANGTPPACGVRFDQWPDPAQRPPSITSCTACAVSRCLITGPKAAGTFHGLDYAQASRTNVDLMVVRDTVIAGVSGFGEGLRVGSSSNAKSYQIDRCWFSGCTVGVHFLSGSGVVRDCGGTGNALDVENDAVVDFFVVEGCNFESSGQALSFTGSSAPVTVRNNRWANLKGPYAIYARNIPGLRLECNFFQGGLNPAGAAVTAPFQPSGRTAMCLHRGGNNWQSLGDMILTQFGYCTSDMPDV
jgi:hypothetical protein